MTSFLMYIRKKAKCMQSNTQRFSAAQIPVIGKSRLKFRNCQFPTIILALLSGTDSQKISVRNYIRTSLRHA